jgi:hypothetical protein
VTWHHSTFAEPWPTVAQPFSELGRVPMTRHAFGGTERVPDAEAMLIARHDNKRPQVGELPFDVMDTAA